MQTRVHTSESESKSEEDRGEGGEFYCAYEEEEEEEERNRVNFEICFSERGWEFRYKCGQASLLKFCIDFAKIL